jgi:hypothetical protein
MNSNFDKIEAYFDGMLTDAERIHFENELKTDTGLQNEYEEYKLAMEASKHLLEIDTKSYLKELESNKADSTNSNYSKLIIPLFLLISVLLLLFYFLNQNNKQKSDQNIKPKLYALYQAPLNKMNRGETLLSKLDTAILLFEQKKMIQAKSLLIELEQSDLKSRYLAHIYFQQDSLDLAKKYFINLQNSSDQNISIDASYHNMLIYLSEANKFAAKKEFDFLKSKNALSPVQEKEILELF